MIARSFKTEYSDPYTYCNECIHGGNGDLKDCDKGKKIKTHVDIGCSIGKLIKGLDYCKVYEPDKIAEKTLFD